jgi:hypothetical protein
MMGEGPAGWTGAYIRKPFATSSVVDLIAFQREFARRHEERSRMRSCSLRRSEVDAAACPGAALPQRSTKDGKASAAKIAVA